MSKVWPISTPLGAQVDIEVQSCWRDPDDLLVQFNKNAVIYIWSVRLSSSQWHKVHHNSRLKNELAIK